MPIHPINSLDDPLLEPYRNMKDRELARFDARFIAEGENVVRRLLNSRIAVESLLLSRRKVEAIAPIVNPAIPIFSATDDVIEKVIGFEFHSGVLACGIRPPSLQLSAILPPPPAKVRVVACQQITNTENVGSLIRIAAAFGASALLLGESCCDPFFRQSVRVSMGTIFSLPLVRSENLCEDLDRLAVGGVETFATVLHPDSEPLATISPPDRVALVFGNEAQGLDEITIRHCRRRATIPMQLGTDSLNVAIAAAVFLYHFTATDR
jgi:tRNA G18 (ribose-2'-O)-methylase SpoU